jgi:OOP family OmpA-OmpF porin
MSATYRTIPILAAAFLMAATPLSAQRNPNWGTGGVELNAHLGLLNDEPEFDPRGEGTDAIRRDAIVGVRVNYVFPWNLFLGGEVQNSLLRLALPGQISNLNSWWFSGVAGYNFQLGQSGQIFPVVGAGAGHFRVDGLSPETDFALTYGLGARYYVWTDLAVRGDLRMHHVPDALVSTREEGTGGPVPSQDLFMLETSIGVTYFLGGPKDSDMDGVYDRGDLCPDTPRGAFVDDDGCPIDSDSDGVPDGLDHCPGTPIGATIDENGCPGDDDLDFVLNGLDLCPDTPAGAFVDRDGCPYDSDGDGFLDGLDRCPDTPEGAEVDEFGCSEIQRGIIEGLLVLSNVYFDFDQSTLRPESGPILDHVGQALLQRPGVRFEIQGHTDGVGTDEYNQGLSERRANTVLSWLLENVPDLDASLFTTVGMGESLPIATNETPEGRQENRRVEFREVE